MLTELLSTRRMLETWLSWEHQSGQSSSPRPWITRATCKICCSLWIVFYTSHLIHIDDNPDDITQPKHQDHQYEHGGDALVPPLPGPRPLARLLTAQPWALDCPEQGEVKGGQHQEWDQRHQDEVHNEDVVSEDMLGQWGYTWSRYVTCCMRLAFWALSDTRQACCHWSKFSALEILEYWRWWQIWSLEWYRKRCW